jgi:hypothetical protein
MDAFRDYVSLYLLCPYRGRLFYKQPSYGYKLQFGVFCPTPRKGIVGVITEGSRILCATKEGLCARIISMRNIVFESVLRLCQL